MRTDVLGVGFDDLTLEEVAAVGAALVEAGASTTRSPPTRSFCWPPSTIRPSGRPCWGPIWCWPTAWGWSTPRKSWAAR
ncbi:MAG: hypothetical protein ACLRNQ_22535 [Flavonifractor plautii]